MEINNRKEGAHEELNSMSEVVSPLSSDDDDEKELNPLKDIFNAHSSTNHQDVATHDQEIYTRNHNNESYHEAKRQRTIEDRVMLEKKRRQVIRDKVDILQRMMTPNPAKMDFVTKLEHIVECIKNLKHQRDLMSMAYIDPAGYTTPFYGAQTPWVSPYANPWSYYAPPVIPQQNMPFIPQYPAPNVQQAHDTTLPDETQP